MRLRELITCSTKPAWRTLYHVTRDLINVEVRQHPHCRLLDVGGRRSWYTSGVNAEVTISELPRLTSRQRTQQLGLTEAMHDRLRGARSNVHSVIYDDMCETKILPNAFDVILAIEVLEHVERDKQFISNVATVLKPNGTFIMTTPNGAVVPNTNPDHKRHYDPQSLRDLLEQSFNVVDIAFTERDGWARVWGARGMSWRRPWYCLQAMVGAPLNRVQSHTDRVRHGGYRAHKIIAIARQPRKA